MVDGVGIQPYPGGLVDGLAGRWGGVILLRCEHPCGVKRVTGINTSMPLLRKTLSRAGGKRGVGGQPYHARALGRWLGCWLSSSDRQHEGVGWTTWISISLIYPR